MSVRDRLIARWGRVGAAIYGLVAGALAIAVAGGAAMVLRQPALFPSLGPSVFLFFERPLDPSASVRNTLVGHAIGLGAGLGALALFGLWTAPSALETGLSLPRVGAAALAIGFTIAIMALLRAEHAPAGATTLIVALGLLTGTRALVFIPAGVVLVTATGFATNRLAGLPVPLWKGDDG